MHNSQCIIHNICSELIIDNGQFLNRTVLRKQSDERKPIIGDILC